MNLSISWFQTVWYESLHPWLHCVYQNMFTSLKLTIVVIAVPRIILLQNYFPSTHPHAYEQVITKVVANTKSVSLSLVNYFDISIIPSECCACGALFRANGPCLCFIFNKSNTLSSRHQPYFFKSFKPTKNGSKSVDIVVFGKILDEKNFVGWQILFWHDSPSTRIGRLETSASWCFDISRGASFGGIWCSRSLKLLLCFSSFMRLFSLYGFQAHNQF